MKTIGAIFRFTFGEQVRKKSFLVTTIILAAVLAVLGALPSIISGVQNTSTTSSGKASSSSVLYLADPQGLLGNSAAEGMKNAFSGYTVREAAESDVSQLEAQVKRADNSQNDVLIEIYPVTASSKTPAGIAFNYYARAVKKGPDPDTISETLHSIYAAHLLGESGVPQSTVASVLSGVSYTEHTGDGSNGMNGFLPAMVLCVLLFITIFSYGVMVATSIASEKTSRVLEILITSTDPSRIVIGKSLAMGALGLLQLCIALAAGMAGMAVSGKGETSLSVLSFSGFTPGLAVLCVAYFLLGFALYAMLAAVAGSTVTSAEEVHSAVQPITLLGMISFYLAYGGFMAQGTPVSLAASLIPFSAPFSMPGRLMMSSVPWWQVVLSLVFLTGCTVLVGLFSIRMYSAAVLHYGKRLKWAELWHMVRRA